jgi:hypothetical protein
MYEKKAYLYDSNPARPYVSRHRRGRRDTLRRRPLPVPKESVIVTLSKQELNKYLIITRAIPSRDSLFYKACYVSNLRNLKAMSLSKL